MRKGGGKRKGNAFENKVFKDLKAFLSEVAEIPVRKTLGSGSSESDADLKLVGNWVVETKCYKRLSDVELARFFDRVEIQATAFGRKPVLIWKENYRGIKAMLLLEGLRAVVEYEDWKKYLMRELGRAEGGVEGDLRRLKKDVGVL